MQRLKAEILRPGDKIKIIAPSSSFFKGAFLEGVSELKEHGFTLDYREDIFERQGYLAGSDQRRYQELMEALNDQQSKAIIAVRGGYGLHRILGKLGQLKKELRPKIVVGFSDICLLHGFIQSQLGWVTLHGPMVSFGFGGEGDFVSRSRLLDMLKGGKPKELLGKSGNNRGKAQGIVYGGNLAILMSSLGTAEEVSFDDKILLIEDWNEPLYRLDRMLNQLLLTGKLDNVRAIGFGLVGHRQENDPEYFAKFEQLAQEILEPLEIPLVFGLPFGHGQVNHPFALGISGSLDADQARVEFLESPFLDPREEK